MNGIFGTRRKPIYSAKQDKNPFIRQVPRFGRISCVIRVLNQLDF
jgi:hypothetical protein